MCYGCWVSECVVGAGLVCCGCWVSECGVGAG